MNRAVSSAIGLLFFRRPRATLGLLLVLVLVAAGEGFSVADRGDLQPRAEFVEAGVAAGLDACIPLCPTASIRPGPQRIKVRSRTCPRWIDSAAGGRPPVRAPDVG